VAPDIVAVAKGISSAYMPIAATVVKNAVFDSFYGDPAADRQVAQVNTYGGHPVAAAVALRNIEILEAERLADRAAETGAYLQDGLRGLMRHTIVGDVRGKGLLQAIELVKDRATKEPVDASVIAGVVEFCRDQGVIVGRGGGGRRFGNVIVLSPPLVITRAECDRLVDTLDRALAAVPNPAT
jgi:adenosylmethionine-8-amino-7-oxononanoate aminotransferase